MDEEGEGSKRRVRGLIQTYKANRKGLKLLSKACKREKVQKRCRKRTEGFCRWLGIWGERDYLMSKVMGVFGITIKDLPWLTVEAGAIHPRARPVRLTGTVQTEILGYAKKKRIKNGSIFQIYSGIFRMADRPGEHLLFHRRHQCCDWTT